MRNLRLSMGVCALSITLLLAGCGQADTGTASLTVTSIPQAEVFVDGVSVGETGSVFALDAGRHKVEVRLDRFQTFETTVELTANASDVLDTVLMPQDPSDPVVIAKLAESLDIEVAPFVAPRTTRGGASKHSPATLLWPARDIRKNGLVNYAIEADETYGGDGALEFRHGRKVLYREAFNPESVTTVRSIPAEVLEHVKVGRTITWGIYFEDQRRPITAKFRIVQRPKAERRLEKLRNSRHMQRQPLITRQIMAATVLENNRLYTEALVANLKVAADHPSSTQPYRGIVTTLRRLDAEHSELFAFVSPFVGGKGGHAGISKPGVTAQNGNVLGLRAWSPTPTATAPTVAAAPTTGSPATSGPHGQGVTPSGSSADGTPEGTEPAAATEVPTTQAGEQVAMLNAVREQSAQADEAGRRAQEVADHAQTDAMTAEAAAAAAEEAAGAAEANATAARLAVEQADEPTREQQEAMAQAGMAAEEAREAANNSREAADQARDAAARMAHDAAEAAQHAEAMSTVLQSALLTGSGNEGTAVEPNADPAAAEQAGREAAAQAVVDAEAGTSQAADAVTAANAELEAADAARSDDPSEDALNRYNEARSALEAAVKAGEEARAALDAARMAVEKLNK